MAQILNIETATTNCSVSIGVDGAVAALVEENSATYSHSEKLHLFIEEALREASFSFSELDAIAVSKGPGSYTGLRIGVSAAKGFCFSLDIPLISVPTLESMAHQVKTTKDMVIIPVLDARRMEVYSCVYDNAYTAIRATRAEIINASSFNEFAIKQQVYIVGDGAEKCKAILQHPNFNFNGEIIPSAREMAKLSHERFKTDDFEDVAYFEPYYLKDFVLQKKRN
ncbi:MAG: tRNA (adenosine(37)-N6)-threonylcarbamoyltransferase complex dimerization subunit type 1 TsaB [Bacteroidota bacterium]